MPCNYTVITFSLIDSYLYGNVLEQMLRLRHQGFIIEEKYKIRNYDGLEFDQYDDPHAQYVAIMDHNTMLACARIRRMDTVYSVTNVDEYGREKTSKITYMVQDLWKNHIPQLQISKSGNYEITRVYAASSLPQKKRAYTLMILIVAIYGKVTQLNGRKCFFVTYKSIVNTVKKLGVEIQATHNIFLPEFDSLQYVITDVNVFNAIKKLRERVNIDMLPKLQKANILK